MIKKHDDKFKENPESEKLTKLGKTKTYFGDKSFFNDTAQIQNIRPVLILNCRFL
jgi:hypothetical protein